MNPWEMDGTVSNLRCWAESSHSAGTTTGTARKTMGTEHCTSSITAGNQCISNIQNSKGVFRVLPKLHKWKKKRKIMCEIIIKSKVPPGTPTLLGIFCLLTNKRRDRLVNSATRQDKIFVTFRVSRCSSDRVSSIPGVSAVVMFLSPVIIFKEYTFCIQGLFWPLTARANYNLNSPGKENLNLNQQLAVTNT